MDITWRERAGVQEGGFTNEAGQPCRIWTSDLSQYETLLVSGNPQRSTAIHLTRAEVATLLPHLQRWAATGRLVPSEGIG